MSNIDHQKSSAKAVVTTPQQTISRQLAAAIVLTLLVFQNLLLLSPVQAGERRTNLPDSADLVSSSIVISQVYGGGGNSGAQYNNDFIELFNRGSAAVNVTGWSVQYASSAGTSWAATALSGSIPPGGYFLVQEGAGANTPAPLPAPDATGTIAMSGTNGKVALSNQPAALTGSCPTGTDVIDFVGFGSANCFEGTAATPVLSNTTAAIRNGSGCTETDQNSADFATGAPIPRNSSSPQNPCSGGSTNPSGVGTANPSAVDPGGSTLLTVTVAPGANPTSSGLTVSGDLSSIGGSAAQMFFDDGTNGDAASGDNIFSFNAAVGGAVSPGAKTLPVIIADAQSRTGNTTISLIVNSQTPTNPGGVGAANPGTVSQGGATLLTVTVTPGTNPASTGISVTGDLSSIGGSANQTFFDDSTNGDVTSGDNIFSFNATVSPATTPGAKTLPTTITDAQSRTGNASIALTVSSPALGQPLPFSQNWTNTNLIAVNDDWSGVPGIVGYRGDNLTSSTGTDPQTILSDGSNTPVNVTANQMNPDTFTSGGVVEFEIANPVVAFQGSGTADAPHLVISLDTTAQSNIAVFYNLRDIDGSADNAVQPVALQYRIGSSGDYTNIPQAFVADATEGPNMATLVTPVAVALPAAVNNQPLVQLRIITANAVGSDEFVGIDDLNIVPNGTIPLSGTGSASPNDVNAGDQTLLKVSVNPATNPNSTGINVTANLTAIGGSASQMFFDDGTNGDAAAGDNIFSFAATVDLVTSGGTKTLPVSISDAQSRTASASIALMVRVPANPQEHLVMGNPTGATTDINTPLNYLLPKNQYVMSYNRDRGSPNWVSWHLDPSWLGSAPRQDDFRPDPSLPADWYHVTQFDYSGSGFDRGHHTPSADRTSSIPDNSATFFMTNMMAQAPDNNQGPWEELESYGRTLVGQGKELYILAGGTGTGGTGSNGGVTNTIANGHVTVPQATWKVILVLPIGDNDLSRVNNNTETIAVIMPNTQGIRNDPWQNYRVSVDQVEQLTGYDFFSNVPPSIQAVIESRIGPAAARKARADFDGDGRTDLSVYRPAEGNWYINGSASGSRVVNFGLAGDEIVPGDFDGDGKTDTAVFRASDAADAPDFYILNSSNQTVSYYQWGASNDIPVVGDYDGDGKTDVAVWRPSNGNWYILNSGGGVTVQEYGISGDIPVVGDFDGNGTSDLTVYRSGQWFTRQTNGSSSIRPFGLAGDKVVSADYDGDGKTDLAVYRPAEGTWYILRSSNSQIIITRFGLSTDVPVPGDYDGDGSDDLAVYRNGTWWVYAGTSGVSVINYGLGTDQAVPGSYLH